MNKLVSFQSHTLYHNDLKLLDSTSLDDELKLSKERLELIVKNKVLVISYPSGSFNNNVTKLAANYYKYGVTTVNGIYKLKEDAYTIPRIRISKKDSIETIGDMLK